MMKSPVLMIIFLSLCLVKSQPTSQLTNDDMMRSADDSNLNEKSIDPESKDEDHDFSRHLRQRNCSDNTDFKHILQDVYDAGLLLIVQRAQKQIDALETQVSKLQDEVDSETSRANELDIKFSKLQDEVDSKASELEGLQKCSGLIYGSSCLRLLYTAGYGVSYDRASDLCAFYGGSLVDIDNVDMFNQVYKYVQENWNDFLDADRNYVDVWLASKYMDNKIVLSSGVNLDSKSVGVWYHGWPKSDGNTNMGLLVDLRPEQGSHGYFNYPEAGSHNCVPLCQFNI